MLFNFAFYHRIFLKNLLIELVAFTSVVFTEVLVPPPSAEASGQREAKATLVSGLLNGQFSKSRNVPKLKDRLIFNFGFAKGYLAKVEPHKPARV